MPPGPEDAEEPVLVPVTKVMVADSVDSELVLLGVGTGHDVGQV